MWANQKLKIIDFFYWNVVTIKILHIIRIFRESQRISCAYAKFQLVRTVFFYFCELLIYTYDIYNHVFWGMVKWSQVQNVKK